MKIIDFTKVFKKYRNRWIALTDSDEVICDGKSLDEVMKKSKRKGYDEPVTMKVPDSKFEFVLHVYSL
ncbi:MAG: DUF5678 domain-containing protein [Candidatus Omnitrophica bacterium]|nr:DUF5678 domain-containing protein [Candidatus Omnitrophota bacterium]